MLIAKCGNFTFLSTHPGFTDEENKMIKNLRFLLRNARQRMLRGEKYQISRWNVNKSMDFAKNDN